MTPGSTLSPMTLRELSTVEFVDASIIWNLNKSVCREYTGFVAPIKAKVMFVP